MTLKPNEWIKSSYSASNSNDCVEVATTPARDTIHIRDSKSPNGPQLTVTPTVWTAFVTYASNN
ncbi:DUF397 domain-containing protein [Streptomyces asiaticus]